MEPLAPTAGKPGVANALMTRRRVVTPYDSAVHPTLERLARRPRRSYQPRIA
jgi:hypothetical protein